MKIINVRIKELFHILIFFITLISLLILCRINFETTKSTVSTFITTAFPSLFPFILFTEIVLKTNVINELSKYISFIPKIFKLSKNSSIVIILSYICGFPSGANMINSLYGEGKLNKKDANILVAFTNNCSPIFLLVTIGISMFGNISVGIILLISHFLSSLIIGFVYSKLYTSIIHENNGILNSYTQKTEENHKKDLSSLSTFDLIQKSILNSLKICGCMMGFMIIFNIFSEIAYVILLKLTNNEYILGVLKGFFEVVGGCTYLTNLSNLNYYYLILIISFISGFSGLAVIFQIRSQFKNVKINIKTIIIFKLLHGIISTILSYILIKYTNILTIQNISVYSNIEIDKVHMHQIYTGYINTLAIVMFIVSTYLLIRYNIKEKKTIKQLYKY